MDYTAIVLIIALILLVVYDIYTQRAKTTPPPETVEVPVEVPVVVPVRDFGPSAPPPPYRPYNNSQIFSQIGILTDPTGGVADILPLYGRLAPGCSTRYQYYTRTSGYQAVQIPITYDGRDCMDTHCSSCNEIYNGVTGITVIGYPGVNFTATVYQIP